MYRGLENKGGIGDRHGSKSVADRYGSARTRQCWLSLRLTWILCTDRRSPKLYPVSMSQCRKFMRTPFFSNNPEASSNS